MKNLHKKIIAVALALVLGSPVLSQGLVIFSNSSSSNKKKIVRQLGIDDFQVYWIVKIYEEDSRYNNYDALYFGKYVNLMFWKNINIVRGTENLKIERNL